MGVMRVKLTREEPLRDLMYSEFLNIIRESADAADLPVQRTGGPQPRTVLMTGVPLAPGHLSRCEYLDFVVCLPITAIEFGHRLGSKLPLGSRVLWQRRMPPGTLSLKAAIRLLRYTVQASVDGERTAAFREASAWPLRQVRKGRERVLDLKRSVPRLCTERGKVILDIKVREEGMPKPEEALASIYGMPVEEASLLPTERSDVQLASFPIFSRPPERE